MRKDILNYLKIAAKIATRRKDGRSFYLGSVGIRSDGTIVEACNGPTPTPQPKAHAEHKVSKKMDYGGVIYTARVLQSTGSFVNARPCLNCIRAMKARKIKRCYYTISENEFGMIDLDKWDERNYAIKQGSCDHA
jgi:tRNA(Arg) A34 adenosine deaminase TadA